MGDSGARLLAKALQINSKLQYISYDRNNVTLQGYSDIAYALQRYVSAFMQYFCCELSGCAFYKVFQIAVITFSIQDFIIILFAPQLLAKCLLLAGICHQFSVYLIKKTFYL